MSWLPSVLVITSLLHPPLWMRLPFAILTTSFLDVSMANLDLTTIEASKKLCILPKSTRIITSTHGVRAWSARDITQRNLEFCLLAPHLLSPPLQTQNLPYPFNFEEDKCQEICTHFQRLLFHHNGKLSIFYLSHPQLSKSPFYYSFDIFESCSCSHLTDLLYLIIFPDDKDTF